MRELRDSARWRTSAHAIAWALWALCAAPCGAQDAQVSLTAADAAARANPDAGMAIADAGTTPADAGTPIADAGARAGETVGPLESAPPPNAARALDEPHAPPGMLSHSTWVVIRVVFGLVLLLGLAYVVGHPRVRRWEERIGVSQLLTTGLPFVGLGLLARAPGVDVLTPEIVEKLSPLLALGFGWLGFLTGFGFRIRRTDETPEGAAPLIALLSVVPAVLTAIACGALFYELMQGELSIEVIVRDAVMIGVAGSLASPSVRAAVERIAGTATADHARRLVTAEAVVAVIALALLSAIYRPTRVEPAWELPPVGWLFVTLGMAGALGLVAWLMLRRPMPRGDSRTVLLGVVAFTAGMAGYLNLSPLVICFLAGLALRNLPGAHHDGVASALERLERPIYSTFLVVAGAVWDVTDWRGWALLAPFVVARLTGRFIGVRWARRAHLDPRSKDLVSNASAALVLAPMSPLSVAMIVSLSTLYVREAVHLLVTPVIVGAAVFEILAQVVGRRARTSDPAIATEEPGR